MAVYAYIALRDGVGAGSHVQGTITADSPRQARDRLRDQGLSVREIVAQTARRREGWWGRYLARRQAARVTGLLQEMATLLGAGIPLLEALDTIARQHAGRLRQAILLLREHIAAGGSLAEAMALQPALFDGPCVGIVEVGESAGTLDASLARLVEFRRRAARLTNRVTSALIYPAIVLAVGLAVSLFLMTYVVPSLLQVLVESGRPLPWATLVVQGVSDLLRGWWWALGLGVLAVAAAAAAVLRSDRGGLAWHRLQLRIPLLGDLVRKQAIARLSMVLATLLKNDLPFVRAAEIAARSVSNRVIRRALTAGAEAVCAGRDIAVALESSGAFPPLVIQIFAVGQASGRLETLLEDLAVDYDTQVDLAASRLAALLEPVLMILLAIAVGFIAFAALLPILEAGNVL